MKITFKHHIDLSISKVLVKFTFIISCNQTMLNNFILKLENILNILCCTYVKNNLILKLVFNLSNF